MQNLEHRVSQVEQILPTLATKHDLQRAVAQLATRDETRAAIDDAVKGLATEASVVEVRRHAQVLHEDVKADIRMVAEAGATLMERLGPR